MTITGLHHITLVTANAQRNIDFYAGVLGLRLVKKTVNFDDPSAYHLYFGNETGAPGSAITFFEWKDVPAGKPGIGGTHHFALSVADENGLLKWKRRLIDLGVKFLAGPLDRKYFKSIYFNDPDGTIVEIATAGPGFAVDEAPEALGSTFIPSLAPMTIGERDEAALAATWPEPVPHITPDMALQDGMHHITAICEDIQRTDAFYSGLLGLKRVKQTNNFDDPSSQHWYWSAGVGAALGKPGTLITYFERNPRKETHARMGAGQTHHFALAVADDDTQLAWRERLLKAGLRVSPVMDRIYFKSIYTNDPDGHIVEIATILPGFATDEPLSTMGQVLMLPPWLESHRREIENSLTPVQAST